MQHNNINTQHILLWHTASPKINYVNMQLTQFYFNMRDNHVNMLLQICCMSTYLISFMLT